MENLKFEDKYSKQINNRVARNFIYPEIIGYLSNNPYSSVKTISTAIKRDLREVYNAIKQMNKLNLIKTEREGRKLFYSLK